MSAIADVPSKKGRVVGLMRMRVRVNSDAEIRVEKHIFACKLTSGVGDYFLRRKIRVIDWQVLGLNPSFATRAKWGHFLLLDYVHGKAKSLIVLAVHG